MIERFVLRYNIFEGKIELASDNQFAHMLQRTLPNGFASDIKLLYERSCSKYPHVRVVSDLFSNFIKDIGL